MSTIKKFGQLQKLYMKENVSQFWKNVYLVWRLCEDCFLPQIRGQVAVSLGDGVKGGLS